MIDSLLGNLSSEHGEPGTRLAGAEGSGTRKAGRWLRHRVPTKWVVGDVSPNN